MSRDSEKLTVFRMSHELAVEVYRLTATYPLGERFGLQAQLRRAAVSTPSNIVEGASRRKTGDYIRFLEIALGSASETRYLLRLSCELGLLPADRHAGLEESFNVLVRSLQKMISSLERCRATSANGS
jgi:four helix bundle protein